MEPTSQPIQNNSASDDNEEFFDEDEFHSFEDCHQMDLSKAQSTESDCDEFKDAKSVREEENERYEDIAVKKSNSDKKLPCIKNNSAKYHEDEVLQDELRHLSATLINRQKSLPNGLKKRTFTVIKREQNEEDYLDFRPCNEEPDQAITKLDSFQSCRDFDTAEMDQILLENQEEIEQNSKEEESPAAFNFERNLQFDYKPNQSARRTIDSANLIEFSREQHEETKVGKSARYSPHNKSGSTQHTSGYQNDSKTLSFASSSVNKNVSCRNKSTKAGVSKLKLPQIAEEYNDYCRDATFTSYLGKLNSHDNDDEESKTFRSHSMISMAPSKASDGIIIPTKKSKKTDTSESLLETLRYVQCIQFSKLPTLVMKFSEDFKYLATGGQDCILRIWEVLHPSDFQNHLVLLKSEPFKEFKQHKKSIVDISWHTTNTKFVLSASLDKTVIMWNCEKAMPSQIYTHSDIITSVCFKPNEDVFATGSFDKNLRLWSIKHKRVISWVAQKNVVSSVQFSPDGERLLSGTMNGMCTVFNTKMNNLDSLATINCKNRKGFFSKGRKVVDIKFTRDREALVTTADSRIRYLDINHSDQKFKYKGHTNKTMGIRASISGNLNLIMSASEDGKIYIWKNVEVAKPNSSSSSKLKDRSSQFETFIPSVDKEDAPSHHLKKDTKSKGSKPVCAIFAPLEIVTKANSKLWKCGIETRGIKQIILVGTLDGKLKIFHSEVPLQL
ncbi:unnamed protein product [Moneuplotes crassus]|uniref:WD repeat-containing protein 44 n=1 Tax=Euplotes crassus TaxID=5936 RepID=A0AAD2D9T1_EUPCR|nr:unnamed protein product [Moneuplotes crassus]